MNYVKILMAMAAMVAFGFVCRPQVCAFLADDSYDIGLAESSGIPEDKGDILVVYSARWCGPCQAIRPNWPLLRGQGYKVAYIDLDNPFAQVGRFDYVTTEIIEKAMEKRPRSVPTLRYYNTSTESFIDHKLVGLKSIEKIKEKLWKTQSLPVLVPEPRP